MNALLNASNIREFDNAAAPLLNELLPNSYRGNYTNWPTCFAALRGALTQIQTKYAYTPSEGVNASWDRLITDAPERGGRWVGTVLQIVLEDINATRAGAHVTGGHAFVDTVGDAAADELDPELLAILEEADTERRTTAELDAFDFAFDPNFDIDDLLNFNDNTRNL